MTPKPKPKPKPKPDPAAEARALAAADDRVLAETKDLIRAANREAAHLLRNGSPEQKERIMRIIFGPTIKEVLTPKAKSRDDEAAEASELVAEFHELRAQMSSLEEPE